MMKICWLFVLLIFVVVVVMICFGFWQCDCVYQKEVLQVSIECYEQVVFVDIGVQLVLFVLIEFYCVWVKGCFMFE